MDPIPSGAPTPETVLFRPSKKRKIYRQRAASPSNEDATPAPTPQAQTLEELVSGASNIEGVTVSMAEILRQRKQHRMRVGGVEFRAAPSSIPARGDNDETAVVIRDKEPGSEAVEQEGAGSVRRFARQTGLVGDVDKHMMAYIDSELAKRRQPSSVTNPQDSSSSTTVPSIGITSGGPPAAPLERQPAALGKLQEIDLGNEARDRNVQRTEQARRRLDGTADSDEDSDGKKPKPLKPRMGRNGKPYIPKPRKRRNSDDVRRDALVDEVLRENRIEMYEPLPANSGSGGAGMGPGGEGAGEGDEDADERLAETFRREFMDAVASRRTKKPALVSNGPGMKGKEEEGLKGPKLGGSRSARAAMREAMLKEQKAGKR